MILAAVIIMGVLMVTGAALALETKNLLVAVVSVGLVSLFASVLYVIMAAPDVAMTEAAIGAGLSTVIFLYALKKTKDRDTEDD